MMQSPFSPFVHRRQTVKDFKRRQSELPSDLIDWDAPEIPELDKQRIIYEEFIKECNEDHAIEMLINEEVYQIAHEVHIESTRKQQDDMLLKERSQNNLLLGQLKLSEDHIQELEGTIKELENLNKNLEVQKREAEDKLNRFEEKAQESHGFVESLEAQVKELQSRVEDLDNQNKELDEQYKELEFRNKELEADLGCQFEAFALKKAEALDLQRKWESAENKLSHLRKEKKLARETK